MNLYDGPWRNVGMFTSDMYCNHCTLNDLEMQNKKLFAILTKHGSAFDDYWYYWITRSNRYVRRVPLWLSDSRSLTRGIRKVDTEKSIRYEPNHKLDEW